MMKTKLLGAAVGAALAFAAHGAMAKTLVYCSEGSPEGFDPALQHSLSRLRLHRHTANVWLWSPQHRSKKHNAQ